MKSRPIDTETNRELLNLLCFL